MAEVAVDTVREVVQRPVGEVLSKTGNRRTRDAYNSYMQDYMRRYRAAQKREVKEGSE